MPTASQFKILSKIGLVEEGRASSARQHGLQRAAEEAGAPVYVPPVPKVFALGNRRIDLDRHQALEAAKSGEGKGGTHFPEMVSMAELVSQPGKKVESMSADDIMSRLHELGWRKEGEAERFMDEKRRREEERIRGEAEQAARRREALDLVNDPLLRRVKEKTQAVPKYSQAPDSRPFSVCFDYLGPSVAHCTVKMKLDELLCELKKTADVKIVSMEYQPRAMHIQGKNIGNRWVVNLESQYGVSRLDGQKMTFGKQRVDIRRYDDVISSEYKTFTRQHDFMKMLQ
ncbi:hypothetical protein ACOMHN_006830 [Nucella lapillus]